jgi:hypothetical protein
MGDMIREWWMEKYVAMCRPNDEDINEINAEQLNVDWNKVKFRTINEIKWVQRSNPIFLSHGRTSITHKRIKLEIHFPSRIFLFFSPKERESFFQKNFDKREKWETLLISQVYFWKCSFDMDQKTYSIVDLCFEELFETWLELILDWWGRRSIGRLKNIEL